MPSNLRSKQIEGYITDSAGNVLRNTNVVIKEPSPSGSNVIINIKSDDDGYFISLPIKNGTYDIYESGIRVLRYYNPANPQAIQSYRVVSDNIPTGISSFNTILSEGDSGDLNNYKYFLQIETDNIDVSTYGNSFPLFSPNGDNSASEYSNLLSGTGFDNISSFYGFTDNSRITHTRFDVELFNPLTSDSSQHRRVRWVGVPAIRFFADSKLVIPLDYYSIVCNSPSKYFDRTGTDNKLSWESLSGSNDEIIKIKQPISESVEISDSLVKGDILELEFDTKSGYSDYSGKFWCIYYKEDSDASYYNIYAKVWKSDNATDNPSITTPLNSIYSASGGSNTDDSGGVKSIKRHNAFYSSIENIGVSTNEKFTVLENICYQGKTYSNSSNSEAYSYQNYS
jgi:hypothetical protein